MVVRYFGSAKRTVTEIHIFYVGVTGKSKFMSFEKCEKIYNYKQNSIVIKLSINIKYLVEV